MMSRNLRICLDLQPPGCFFSPLPSRNLNFRKQTSCPAHIDYRKTSSSSNNQAYDMTIGRRSANYEPNIWDFSFLQSLSSNLTAESYERVSKLKEAVRLIFDDEDMTTIALLEMIDNVERLGLGHRFEIEIKKALDNIVSMKGNYLLAETKQYEDLHAIALHFRLLRKHGYRVSEDVFTRFMKDSMGNFQPNINNVKGMLCLYEATQLALEGETMLEEIKSFTAEHLKDIISKEDSTLNHMEKQVKHSLVLPLHHRMLRLESRWYIENIYMRRVSIYPELLELAILDFNMVQETHRDDLREMSSWWKDLGLGSELSFARDRLMENFLWTIGVIYEPHFSYCRKGLTKINSLITTIDDVYDVFGTLDELELFTQIVDRWDVKAMDQLPNYLKICFLALDDTTKEIAYDVYKEKHVDVTKYLRKAWGDLCKSYLIEAKWFYDKYTPTLDEYLNNAWISISGPVILVHAYFLIKQEITKEGLDCIESYTDLIRWSSMILRLCNDQGTSTAEIERGDVPKSVQCYMQEAGVSEDIARQHIRHLTNEIWKKMNKDIIAYNPHFSQTFIGVAINLARMAECMYQYGDGHGIQNRETKTRVSLLLLEPISLHRSTTLEPTCNWL